MIINGNDSPSVQTDLHTDTHTHTHTHTHTSINRHSETHTHTTHRQTDINKRRYTDTKIHHVITDTKIHHIRAIPKTISNTIDTKIHHAPLKL